MPYPDYYRPNPGSRRYVIHLPRWYAQSHPDEDFAETFAVWLTPDSKWREEYRGSHALEKLRYVDRLMNELAGQRPPVRTRARPEPLHRIKTTLAEHYAEKRARYHTPPYRAYDRVLLRFFSRPEKSTGHARKAAVFLRGHRARIRRMVAHATGEREFAVDTVLSEMIWRCRELDLRAVGRQQDLAAEFAILLAARSEQFIYRGKRWHAL